MQAIVLPMLLLHDLIRSPLCVMGDGLGSTNLPLHAGNADLLARLFVVVEPLTIGQVDGSEAGGSICPLCLKVALSLELCELESSAVEFEHGEHLGGVGLLVCGRRGFDAGRVLSLAVFAPPDKIRLALAAADLGLVEAAEGDIVGVCFATRGALDSECVEEGGIGRVGGTEFGDTVKLCFKGECEHHVGEEGLCSCVYG